MKTPEGSPHPPPSAHWPPWKDRPLAFIRARLHYAWAITSAAACTVVCGIGNVAGYKRHPSPRTWHRWSTRWASWILASMGVRVQATHDPALNTDGPYIYVANHQNMLDILLHLASAPTLFGFLAKKELEKVPFMGAAMKASPCIFIDRSTPREALKSLQAAAQEIRAGTPVLIYAEGTRSRTNALGRFKRGAFELAIASGVPIVPAVIIDSYRLLDETKKMSRSGTAHVHYGAPIPVDGWTSEQMHELRDFTHRRIQDLLDQAVQKGVPTLEQ